MKLNSVCLRDAVRHPGKETDKSTMFAARKGFELTLQGDLLVIRLGNKVRIVPIANIVDAEPLDDPKEHYEGPPVAVAAKKGKPTTKELATP